MTLIKWKNPNYVARRTGLFPGLPRMFDELMADDFFGKDFAAHVPAVNVFEDEGSFHIELSAPGFTKEEIKVSIENDTMTVSGEHKAEKTEGNKNYSLKEFSYGSFARSFSMPETTDPEKVEAKFENGILMVSIAKKESVKANPVKEIKIV